MSESLDNLVEKSERLLALIATYESCAVAFSGGVDSAVVAKAAQLALGERAVAVTGTSAALAVGELTDAKQLASLIGIRHVVLATEEFANPNYVANHADRCYHCKTELYSQLGDLSDRLGVQVVANGSNADDLGDYRPGLRAADEHKVRSPLAECGFTKRDVRALAATWNLPIAEKPATPCLSSRVAYGLQVTPERLAMIDEAERFLRSLGMAELRVRYHADDMARIEVPLDRLPQLCQAETRQAVVDRLTRLGFKFVTLDLAGFRSGGFTKLVPSEMLRRFS
ncbi:MAG TPA: ATP-dependent sacrificial sulfur transferase LarE [Lacipirellulaceae bacterium]|nr:ATP-dependent sacrificial sulfur transferase LarE [Lacipirellulaceae bacterium]